MSSEHTQPERRTSHTCTRPPASPETSSNSERKDHAAQRTASRWPSTVWVMAPLRRSPSCARAHHGRGEAGGDGASARHRGGLSVGDGAAAPST
eukprot:365663-Chlamydomonas_euryale.AAC.2